MRPEMAAVGVVLKSSDSQWSAALSVAAIQSRMESDRLNFIVDLLRQETAIAQARLKQLD